MLQSLYVKDFAIIDEVEVQFGPGLTVLTGETGAGKSLLVDALSLLSGDRGDSGWIRHGCERAELTASFSLSGQPELQRWLQDEELDAGDECQLRRVLRAEGASRCWINGRPVPLQTLRQAAEKLIRIHGQHEHQALVSRSHQLALLDGYGGESELLVRVARLAEAWQHTRARIDALCGSSEQRAERLDWLAFQISELEAIPLDSGSLAALEAEHRQQAHAEELLRLGAEQAALLDGDDGPALTGMLGALETSLQRSAALDPACTPLLELLEQARIALDELGDSLRRRGDAIEVDPERLAELESRLQQLADLSRKHRLPVDQLQQRLESLREERAELDRAGEELAELETRERALLGDYRAAAVELGARRRASAGALETEVARLMGELGMAGGRVRFEFDRRDGEPPSPLGDERVELLVSANPGQPPQPLRKVASGGELSRIGLALQVATLDQHDVTTLVFDEVDAGIGGATGDVVGAKLRQLGGNLQVLCVTHLPQVAAQAHAQLHASKQHDGERTRTTIRSLDRDQRIIEIARMLGGEGTDTSTAHAQRMLASASAL